MDPTFSPLCGALHHVVEATEAIEKYDNMKILKLEKKLRPLSINNYKIILCEKYYNI